MNYPILVQTALNNPLIKSLTIHVRHNPPCTIYYLSDKDNHVIDEITIIPISEREPEKEALLRLATGTRDELLTEINTTSYPQYPTNGDGREIIMRGGSKHGKVVVPREHRCSILKFCKSEQALFELLHDPQLWCIAYRTYWGFMEWKSRTPHSSYEQYRKHYLSK